MLSNIFALFAQGTVGLDLTLNLAAQIAFNETFSNVLSAKISELKALQDAQNRLTIPLTLSGTAPNIIVLPDATKLLELAAKGAIQEKAGKLLDQMLGGSKSDSKKKGLGSMLGF